eukprot:TCALIF_01524-PA protein Name:"Protein of unknown function" AED:0.03 eAED:0.03 QI:141/1/0.5/1/1/0.5/2/0/159
MISRSVVSDALVGESSDIRGQEGGEREDLKTKSSKHRERLKQFGARKSTSIYDTGPLCSVEVQTVEPGDLLQVTEQIRCLVPLNTTNRVRTAKVLTMPSQVNQDQARADRSLAPNVDQENPRHSLPRDSNQGQTEEMPSNDLVPLPEDRFPLKMAPNDP